MKNDVARDVCVCLSKRTDTLRESGGWGALLKRGVGGAGLYAHSEDEKACGNTADAHEKHSGEGNMEKNFWLQWPNL